MSVRMKVSSEQRRGLIEEPIPRRDSERKDRETGQALSHLKNPSYVSP